MLRAIGLFVVGGLITLIIGFAMVISGILPFILLILAIIFVCWVLFAVFSTIYIFLNMKIKKFKDKAKARKEYKDKKERLYRIGIFRVFQNEDGKYYVKKEDNIIDYAKTKKEAINIANNLYDKEFY
ncbi:MAG: hypothetical protein LBU40_00860 [Methanobrevibacter sp.]|jgi:membrane protein implicated in regulation of membrane protease activity|nr:hypothetical protein [Methanobrevibacter sp.]